MTPIARVRDTMAALAALAPALGLPADAEPQAVVAAVERLVVANRVAAERHAELLTRLDRAVGEATLARHDLQALRRERAERAERVA